MAYNVNDVPAEYRTLSRRDHTKRKEYLLSTEGITKLYTFSNFSDDNTCFNHTNSLKWDNYHNFLYSKNVLILFNKETNKKHQQNNIKKLEDKIGEEILFSDVDRYIYIKALELVKSELSILSFNDVAVEFSMNESVHFTFSFGNDRILMIDKFIYPSVHDLKDDQIFYSYFINKNLISSNVVEISDFVKKFQAYITM